MNYHQQATNTILMVRPADFTFNAETAADNEFQQQLPGTDVKSEALREFDAAVALLRKEGVNVLVLEKDSRLSEMPDAVFPNNWFASDEEGCLHIFPMKALNRRAETEQLPGVLRLLEEAGFSGRSIVDWRKKLGQEMALEGTGSLILDRANKRFFASLSERTGKEACLGFAEETGFTPILFHTCSSAGFAYYHTNVVMSIGPELVIACLECIPDEEERSRVKTEILRHHHLIEISISQLEKGFCGNLLQVLNDKGELLTILSSTAFHAFSEVQRKEMEKYGRLIPVPIPVIEQVGGGSIRCMMAEIFSPRKTG
jgi:hypothetical protein